MTEEQMLQHKEMEPLHITRKSLEGKAIGPELGPQWVALSIQLEEIEGGPVPEVRREALRLILQEGLIVKVTVALAKRGWELRDWTCD